MNLFRSEEHIDLWLAGRAHGATTSVSTLSALAHRWWDDRLSPEWTPHAREDNQRILDELDLTGEFWQLA
jgi:hypothetical protein